MCTPAVRPKGAALYRKLYNSPLTYLEHGARFWLPSKARRLGVGPDDRRFLSAQNAEVKVYVARTASCIEAANSSTVIFPSPF